MTMMLSADLPTAAADASGVRRRLQARARRLAKRALTLAGKGRMDEAIACQTEVAALRPNDPAAFHRLGLLYREVRRIDPAVQAFRQATHLSPAQRDPREALTETFVEAGRYPEAVTEARALLKLVPRSLFARDALSVAYLQLGQLERALQTTGEMVWLDPLNPGHHFRRGLLFQQMGNTKAAVGEYSRALEMAHPESEVYSDSADALEMLDDGQLRHILLLASEDRLFLLKLRRDAAEASQERGFYLSEEGQSRLEFVVPREFPDFPGDFPMSSTWGSAGMYN